MKYLCTVHGPVDDDPEAPQPMISPAAAGDVATVTVRNGRVSVRHVGGRNAAGEPLQFLLEAWDLNDAIRLASHHPSARSGTLEVRPIPVFEPP